MTVRNNFVILSLLTLAFATAALAQQKTVKAKRDQKPTTTAAVTEPPTPFVQYAFPPGARQGGTVEVTCSGQNLAGASAVRVTGSGVAAKIKEVVNLTTVKLSILIDAGAEPGVREMRLITAGGVSNRFRFCVGQLPEVNEAEPNERDQPQAIGTLPVTLNGQIMEGDRDCFRFSAKAGQTLVFAAEARALVPFIADAVPGWNDVVLTLYDAAGRQLASVDDLGFRPDPVLVCKIPADGEYVIEASDILFRGRGDFVYRLSIGELPYITHIFPLGGPAGQSSIVQLFGVNLPTTTMNLSSTPSDPAAPRFVRINRNGILSNTMPFATSNLRETPESEPNDSTSAPQRLDVPTVVNGRIDRPGDADYFAFRAEPGQKLTVDVRARRLESPLDSIITIYRMNGTRLAENDDFVDVDQPLITHHADASLTFTVPPNSGGRLVLRVRDVQGGGGPQYAYRLSVSAPKPDFALRVSPDNPRVARGDSAVLTVTAIRKDGFAGEINFSAAGLPPGFIASPAVIGARQDQILLTITAPGDAGSAIVLPTITGSATIEGRQVTRTARPAEAVMQAFSYTHHVPAKELLLGVVEFDTFTLDRKDAAKTIELKTDSTAEITLVVRRKPGVKGQIAFKPAAVTPGLSVRSVFIPADKDQATLTLVAGKQAQPGTRYNLVLTGSLKIGKETITRSLPAIPVVITTAPQTQPAATRPVASRPK
jgi:hypothetical protein